MNKELTATKLLSITCEITASRKLLSCLQKQGVRSVRISDVRIEEFNGDSPTDLNEAQHKIECLVDTAMIGPIVSEIKSILLKNFDLGFYVTDAFVLRPEIFFSQSNDKV